jgi:Uma2 family endonuclease
MMLEEALMSTITPPPTLTSLPLLIPDVNVSARMIEDRRARGIDHHDEVWEGVYVMSPLANNEHQQLTTLLAAILVEVIDRSGLGQSFAGVNLTDQQDNWERNFRCPDAVTYLKGNPAQNRGSHWFGGPDLAIEIISPYDRSREKLDFYAKIGTRELLVIDRDPWVLEMFKLVEGKLVLDAASSPTQPGAVRSATTELEFRLVEGEGRPNILVVHSRDRRQWIV